MRIRCVLLATLTLLFGLHIFRVYLPTAIWYLGQFLSSEGLALYALATFALTLLAPLMLRWLSERFMLMLTVGGLALVRLAIQLIRVPQADLALATAGVGLLGWFIPLWWQSRRNCPHQSDIPVMAVAFPLAFLLDTGSRSLLLSYDLAWRTGLESTLVVFGLVGLTLMILFQEVKVGASEGAIEEPSLNRVLPIIGLGPWLFVAMTVNHNPAALAASTGWQDIPAHIMVNGFTAVGAVAAVLVAGWSALQRWYWVLLGGGLLVGALALLIAGVGPGWLWVGLVSLNSWAALGELLTGTVRIGSLRPGLWRSGVTTFLALVVMLAIVILVDEYDVLWMTPVAGGIVVLAALWATRAKAGRDGDALRKRSAFVSAVGGGVLLAVAVWALSYRTPQVTAVPSGDRPLRVMVYNIHHGINADFVMDLETIAHVIAAQNPDVVALNEVNRARASNGFVDTLMLVSRRLGMRYVFGANYPDGQYGNALLSRYPVLSWDNTHYSRNTTEIRGLLRAEVQTSGEPIDFFATHLDHLSSTDHARTEQMAEALTLWGGDPRGILLGDLNAEPDAPELQSVYEAGFVDALAAVGREDAFTSWGQVPDRRIDYIFVTPDLSLRNAWVVVSRASDHLPVLAEVEP